MTSETVNLFIGLHYQMYMFVNRKIMLYILNSFERKLISTVNVIVSSNKWCSNMYSQLLQCFRTQVD